MSHHAASGKYTSVISAWEIVANYAAAVAAYYSAVYDLETGMITGSERIYASLRESTEEARSLCEAALKELNAHEAKHRCAA